MGQTRRNFPPSFKAKVVLEMLEETKSVSELSSEYGVHPTVLHRWRREVLENLPCLFSRKDDWGAEKAQYEGKIEELYTEIGRLSAQLSWLKKRALLLSRSERVALVEWQDRELPLKTQAELLGLNRSHLYSKPRGPSEEEVALKREIDEIFTKCPF